MRGNPSRLDGFIALCLVMAALAKAQEMQPVFATYVEERDADFGAAVQADFPHSFAGVATSTWSLSSMAGSRTP